MSATNKVRNKLQKVGGRAKETIGRVTGNRRLENRGVRDQVTADVKDVGERVKYTLGGRWGRGGRRI